MEIFYADADISKHRPMKIMFEQNSSHRITYTTASGKELLSTLESCVPDLLIMDFILLDYDGLWVLRKLASAFPRPAILFYTCISQEQILSHALQLGADGMASKNEPFRMLLQKIEEVFDRVCACKNAPEILERLPSPVLVQAVSRLISQLGILPNLKGYQYSRDAVLRLIQAPSIVGQSMHEIYADLADKYGTKPYCIERNIRNAIEIAWVKGDIQTINDLFGYTVKPDKGKPTNAEFLVLLADKIRLIQHKGA